MADLALFAGFEALPRPFDPVAAAAGREHFMAAAEDAALSRFAHRFATAPKGRALLDALFGNSPYLGQILLKEIAFLREMTRLGPEAALAKLIADLDPPPIPAETAALMARLRIAKQRLALLVAIMDIAGAWPLAKITGTLSEFAEAALGATLRHLLRQGQGAGEIAVADAAHPDAHCGFTVLGMGKLGAHELNYSSDIDIIFLYDPERLGYRGGRSVSDYAVRLAKDIVHVLQAPTAEGYVFRTDLRLRPDPGATPAAISTAAAEHYYESLGRTWERAAMIKARPVAGDIALGKTFLERIKPFVWRRNLDFAAIEDVHAVKRQIHDTKGHRHIAIAGHDIKVGRGGIREIEFFIQTQQLIIGGREPRLRQSDTCGALRAFADAGRLSSPVARKMIAAYDFLRRLEHRLQMIADEQTHRMPADEAGIAHVATFLGYAKPDAFRRELMAVLSGVQKHYDALFEPSAPAASESRLVFGDVDSDPATIAALGQLGFAAPEQVASRVRVWHHGLYRASRSERARNLLIGLTPNLLAALGKTANPDFAFAKLDEFLGKLPAGVQLFALFQANPKLLDLAAEIMGSAPGLAERLTRDPSLFDQVLETDFYRPLPGLSRLKALLSGELTEAATFEDVLDIARRFVNRLKFRVGVQMLQAVIGPLAAGRALTDIAEAALVALLPRVQAVFAESHGEIAGGEFAVIGMGTLGAREMTFRSDLDLILIYDHPPDAPPTKGRYPLAPSQYYTRLSQRLIGALTAPTAEGELYAVDMRLRPSGNAGPVAVHRETFRRYQRDQAWTFEHMALTRARVIAGPAPLTRRLRAIMTRTLRVPRKPEKLAADVIDMRARIAAQYRTRDSWAVKYVRGGMVDLDFIAQYLLLRHAAAQPRILANNSGDALRRLATAGVLSAAEADRLGHAYRLLYSVHAGLRLCTGESGAPDAIPEGLQMVLAKVTGAKSFSALAAALRRTEADVLARFKTMIKVPKRAKTRQSA